MMARTLDVRGLKCPLPIVKAKKELDGMAPGDLLEVMATDPGSVADFQGWAKVAKNVELIGQETESLDGASVYVHFVKRAA